MCYLQKGKLQSKLYNFSQKNIFLSKHPPCRLILLNSTKHSCAQLKTLVAFTQTVKTASPALHNTVCADQWNYFSICDRFYNDRREQKKKKKDHSKRDRLLFASLDQSLAASEAMLSLARQRGKNLLSDESINLMFHQSAHRFPLHTTHLSLPCREEIFVGVQEGAVRWTVGNCCFQQLKDTFSKTTMELIFGLQLP